MKQGLSQIQAPVPLLNFVDYQLLASVLFKLMQLDIVERFTKDQAEICFSQLKFR